jgi:phospholipid/cholesterol/gamma-HCH transport system ATP-binding protein
MDSAKRIADRIAMIHEGKIVWVGDVAKIEDSGNDIVDQFIHGRVDGPMSAALLGTPAA